MNRLKRIIHSNPAIHRYLSDDWVKATVSLVGSFAFNLLYAVWEIICGIYYQSYWFATLGGYYILLMLARLILLCELRGRKGANGTEWKKYRACGVLLLFMNLVLSGIVVLAVMNGQGSHYAGYLIYAVAAYTFYRVGVSIKRLVKHRNDNNPIFAASKSISFASTMVSMLSLEIAMILQFGNDKAFFQTMTVLTGSGVCIVISATAIYMIVTAQKNI